MRGASFDRASCLESDVHPKLPYIMYGATAAAWFASFSLKALVSLVNRRIDVRMVRFWCSM